MDFYNKHFYRITRHVDPNGMLNVLINVYSNEKCLDRYFRSDKDFRKLDVPWMCDQLILLLTNFDEVFDISSAIQFLQNDFQRKKYPFVLFTQAFMGLILVQKKSTSAYFSYCRVSTIALYKKKITLDKVPKKKKKKKPASNNQSLNEKTISEQKVVLSMNQDQVFPGLKTNHNEIDILLNHSRHTKNAIEMILPEMIVSNQTVSNIQIPQEQNTISNLNSEENIDIIQRRSYSEQLKFIPLPSIEAIMVSNQNILLEKTPLPKNDEKLYQSVEQLQNKINLPNKKLIEKPKDSLHLQEQLNEMASEKQDNLTNLLKRKRSSKFTMRNLKKKPIEQSSKVLKNRMKKLEGELSDRPLECIAIKYIHQTVNHLPLRHNLYYNKLNISFAALTLNMELEENKSQDDVFNTEITMSNFKAITERFNYNNISNSCIYQQCINNSLPHLSLLPLADEYLVNNSLVWRDTINEINKKLEDSLRDISEVSKVDHSKWEVFKEKMKQRVSQCIVPHNSLICPELSHVDVSQPILEFPLPHQIDDLLNDKTVTENQNLNNLPQIYHDNILHVPSNEDLLSQLLPIEKSLEIEKLPKENCLLSIQNNVESIAEYHKQPIDILQMISNSLLQFPEKKSCILFTDLCPIHVTNRKNAILVFWELLGLHKNGIVKLHQPLNTTKPSLISIKLCVENFF